MTSGAPAFERLSVIQDDLPLDGALNMALDEVLLGSADCVPVLRFYRWAQPTVSFGYFEPVAAARGIARGRGIVRRWTGGGIVEHGDDLTFTLIVPREEAFARVRPAESYRLIHAALAWALECSGIGSRAHGDLPSRPTDDRRPNACFEHPVLHDLMTEGKKVAGGAQRRTRTGLLHQGSIQPAVADERSWQEAVRCELPGALGRLCMARTLTSDEVARAQTLADTKYATPTWTDRV